MATKYRVLGQAALAQTTLTDIYTCPNSAVLSSIVVCNRTAGALTVRIAVAVAGIADATKQYLAYGESVAANTRLTLGKGVTLGPGDVIRGYASDVGLSVNIFGGEII